MCQPLVIIDIQTLLTGSYHIQAPGSTEIGECKVNAASAADALRTVIDELLTEGFAVPLKVVYAQVVVPAGFVVVVRTETLARDQFLLPVAVNVRPLQIVV